jgi:hypothetical protein
MTFIMALVGVLAWLCLLLARALSAPRKSGHSLASMKIHRVVRKAELAKKPADESGKEVSLTQS